MQQPSKSKYHAQDYKQHVTDLEQGGPSSTFVLRVLGIRHDISDGVGSQQRTVALPEAHGCM